MLLRPDIARIDGNCSPLVPEPDIARLADRIHRKTLITRLAMFAVREREAQLVA